MHTSASGPEATLGKESTSQSLCTVLLKRCATNKLSTLALSAGNNQRSALLTSEEARTSRVGRATQPGGCSVPEVCPSLLQGCPGMPASSPALPPITTPDLFLSPFQTQLMLLFLQEALPADRSHQGPPWGTHSPGFPTPSCGLTVMSPSASPLPPNPRADARHTEGPPASSWSVPALRRMVTVLQKQARRALRQRRSDAPTLPPQPEGGGRHPPGLVRITWGKASVDVTDRSLSEGPGSCPGDHPGGQLGSATCCPAVRSIMLAIKSLCPEPSHAISAEQSQPHLRLLKSHFHQTAVKRGARGGLAGSHY